MLPRLLRPMSSVLKGQIRHSLAVGERSAAGPVIPPILPCPCRRPRQQGRAVRAQLVAPAESSRRALPLISVSVGEHARDISRTTCIAWNLRFLASSRGWANASAAQQVSIASIGGGGRRRSGEGWVTLPYFGIRSKLVYLTLVRRRSRTSSGPRGGRKGICHDHALHWRRPLPGHPRAREHAGCCRARCTRRVRRFGRQGHARQARKSSRFMEAAPMAIRRDPDEAARRPRSARRARTILEAPRSRRRARGASRVSESNSARMKELARQLDRRASNGCRSAPSRRRRSNRSVRGPGRGGRGTRPGAVRGRGGGAGREPRGGSEGAARKGTRRGSDRMPFRRQAAGRRGDAGRPSRRGGGAPPSRGAGRRRRAAGESR